MEMQLGCFSTDLILNYCYYHGIKVNTDELSMKSERWRNELCIQNSILVQWLIEGKENELVTKERICLWYVDWSGTVKLTNSSYLLSLFYSTNLYSLYEENVKTLLFVDFSSIWFFFCYCLIKCHQLHQLILRFKVQKLEEYHILLEVF